MAQTAVPERARVIRYQNKFYREYIRGNRFSKVIGTDENSPIQLNEDLKRLRGEQTTFYLVNRLKGPGRTGYQTLKGHEEALDTRAFRVKIGLTRHAVTHWETDEQFSAIDLVEAKNATLQDWFKENLRDRIIASLGSFSTDGFAHIPYASADETTVKDVWCANNADRVMFGTRAFNADHSAGLATLVSGTDKVDEETLARLKDLAKVANPKIKPIKVKDEEEWYLFYCGTSLFRQAQKALAQLNREAWIRSKGESNPLFTGGDLIADGIIIKEVPEIGSLPGTPGSSGSTKVAPAYLVGAQAVAYAVAKRSQLIKDEDDYGEVKGAGIKMLDAVAKMYFGSGVDEADNPKQHGVATAYFAHA